MTEANAGARAEAADARGAADGAGAAAPDSAT